jgi:coproporphyrinogen III oxidase
MRKNYTQNAKVDKLYQRGRYFDFKLTEPEIWKGIDFLNKVRAFSGGSIEPVTQLGYALAKSGSREQAQVVIEELKSFAA